MHGLARGNSFPLDGLRCYPPNTRKGTVVSASSVQTCAPPVTRTSRTSATGTKRRSSSGPALDDSTNTGRVQAAQLAHPVPTAATAPKPTASAAPPPGASRPIPNARTPATSVPTHTSSSVRVTQGGALLRAPVLNSAPSATAVRRVTAASMGSGGYTATARRSTTTSASSSAASASTAASPATAAAASIPPTQPPARYIVAAVDPDLGGALAVIHWDVFPGEEGYTTAGTGPPPRPTRRREKAPTAAGEAEAADGEEGSAGGGGGADEDDGLWLPTPPPPPADRSRWVISVWDMPVSTAERQKPTATGGVSRRRLLHVAGARAMLAAALRSALPPRGWGYQVGLYGYVEVPPILPGDGNIAAYTSLWSTGAWLGLMTGMGFMVGSTPVRRWKMDLGLFGARSKEAGLALARALFPEQCKILTHKKHHGRADALLIAAWALGASLPPRLAGTLRRSRITVDELLAQHPKVGLLWGDPRPPAPTDAYGNLLTPERDIEEEIEAAGARIERLEAERAERQLAKKSAAGRRRKTKAAAAVDSEEAQQVDGSGGGQDGATSSGVGRRKRSTTASSGTAAKRGRKRKGAVEGAEAAPAVEAAEEQSRPVPVAGESKAEAAAPRRRRRAACAPVEAEQRPAQAATVSEPEHVELAPVRPKRTRKTKADAADAKAVGADAGVVTGPDAVEAQGSGEGTPEAATKVVRRRSSKKAQPAGA